MSRYNNNAQYPPQGGQQQQQPYHAGPPQRAPTNPRSPVSPGGPGYPPQQPLGYGGGYNHNVGHQGYDIDDSDGAGLMNNQGRAGGPPPHRNNTMNHQLDRNGYPQGPGLMPRSVSKLDRAATMNRRVSAVYLPVNVSLTQTRAACALLVVISRAKEETRILIMDGYTRKTGRGTLSTHCFA